MLFGLIARGAWSNSTQKVEISGSGNYPRPFSKGAFPLPRPPITTKADLVTGDKTKIMNTKGQSMELTAYRMTKGLCKKCGEKWGKGHQCADSVHLNALQEIWDLINDHNTDVSDATEGNVNEQIFLALSEAAVSGEEAPRTLKIRCAIQNIQILVLIDTCSFHSFISEHVATQLQGVTKVVRPARVQVANGTIIHSSEELLQVEWSLQGFLFCSHLKVIPLHSFDMVVGMEWLERFSPKQIHWAQKWLKVPYGASSITLQGLLPNSLDCAIIELSQITSDVQWDEKVELPEEI
jgi:hypothetical protein